MTHDPIRLLADPTAPAGLRRDVSAAARHRVAYDVSAGAARFEAKLAQGAGAASSGWSAAALGFGALILGGLIAAVALRPGAPPEPTALGSLAGGDAAARAVEAPVAPPTAAPVEAVAVEAVAPVEVVAPVEAPVEVAAPEVEGAEDHVPGAMVEEAPAARPGKAPRPRVRRPAAEAPAEAPAPTGADYLREARSLQAARGLLGRDPAGALERAEAGAREFVGGAFAQEWEGVAILALFEIGRAEQAQARAEEFLARYPKGPYSVQVREASQRR